MPPIPGEECLLTVFADIHYYFAAPCPKSLHQRFEKGSYLYIYHDASQNKARIEIANNPGTPDQDAFCGVLHNAHIQHSTQFPTRSTLRVDGIHNFNPHQETQNDWHLPFLDGHDDRHRLLRLHTLDIYFWTLNDANQFLDTIGRVLATNQLDTDRATTSAQPDKPMSSVVQQLENVAVSDPAYQNGQTPNSRPESTPGAPSIPQNMQQTMSFPPPPSGPQADQPQAAPVNQSPPEEKKEPETPAPLPYNPAAPAAPEPIKHREKTPPPEDGTEGTGLLAAAAADQGIPYTPPHQVPNGAGMSFVPPPTSPPANPHPYTSTPPSATGYASPPPSAGLPRSATFPMQQQQAIQSPALPSPGPPPYQQYYLGTPAWPGSPSSMTFAPPPQDPNAHLYGHQTYGTPPHHLGHQYHSSMQSGGYSHYTYDQSLMRQPGHVPADHEIHQQAYRPSEAEMNSNAQKYAQKAMKAPGQRPHHLEEKAARVESGVNRFLKKLEKKL